MHPSLGVTASRRRLRQGQQSSGCLGAGACSAFAPPGAARLAGGPRAVAGGPRAAARCAGRAASSSRAERPGRCAQAKGRQLRFLANVDPVDVARALNGLRQETTLVVVVSKTFTTAETMLNARTVRCAGPARARRGAAWRACSFTGPAVLGRAAGSARARGARGGGPRPGAPAAASSALPCLMLGLR